jgi:uncharacterized phiE125 gp8 family phage protein
MQYQARDVAGFTELVTVDECKSHLYLPDDADTTLLAAYILTARRWVEQYCALPLIEKTVTVHYEEFPTGKISLLLPLCTEEADITSLTYTDVDNENQTILPADTILANIPNPNYLIPIADWPTGARNINITYTATAYYDKAALKPAIMLMVAHIYENREVVETKFNNSLRNLLSVYRKTYHP